ncbi:MAG: hypothetical protein HY690_00045 [Chloroflexi bacterium]|nr:hypothetical protein [Chloroflexota bacterium]
MEVVEFFRSWLVGAAALTGGPRTAILGGSPNQVHRIISATFIRAAASFKTKIRTRGSSADNAPFRYHLLRLVL